MLALRTYCSFFGVFFKILPVLLIWESAHTYGWASDMASDRAQLVQSTGGPTSPLAPDAFDYESFMAKLAKEADKAMEQLYVDLGPKQRHRLLRSPPFNKYLTEISDSDRNRLLLMLDPNELSVELRPHLLHQIDAAFEQFQKHLRTRGTLTDLFQNARENRQKYTQERHTKFLHDLVELPTEQAESLVTEYVGALWSYNKFSFALSRDMIQGFFDKALESSYNDIAAENDLGKLIDRGIKMLENRRQYIETHTLKRSYEITPEILHARHALARSYLMHQVFLRGIWDVSQWNEDTAPKIYKAQKLNGLLDEYKMLTNMIFTFLDQEAQKARASLGQKDS